MYYERTLTNIPIEKNTSFKEGNDATVTLVDYDFENKDKAQFPNSFYKLLEKSLNLYGHQNAITDRVILFDIDFEKVENIFQAIGFESLKKQKIEEIFNRAGDADESPIINLIKDNKSLIDLIQEENSDIPDKIDDEKQMCILFYTKIGFAYCYYRIICSNQKISLFEIPQNAYTGEVYYMLYVSNEHYVFLNNYISQIQYRFPITSVYKKFANQLNVSILVDFDMVNGEWQPKIDYYTFSELLKKSCKGEKISEDGTVFSFSNTNSRSIGFIGQYSEIIKSIEFKSLEPNDDNTKLIRIDHHKMLNNFSHNKPALISTNFSANPIFITYFPNNLPPTDPYVVDAAQYMYMLMRRCSIVTFIVPSPENRSTPPFQANNTIQNVGSNAQMHGHSKTLVFKENIINPFTLYNDYPFVNFDSIFSFLSWEKWVGVQCDLGNLDDFKLTAAEVERITKTNHNIVYPSVSIKKETIEFFRNTIFADEPILKKELFNQNSNLSLEENINLMYDKYEGVINEIFDPVSEISMSKKHECMRCCGVMDAIDNICPSCQTLANQTKNPVRKKELEAIEESVSKGWMKIFELYQNKSKELFVKWFMKLWVKSTMLYNWEKFEEHNLLRIPVERMQQIKAKYSDSIFSNDIFPEKGKELDDAPDLSKVSDFVNEMIESSSIYNTDRLNEFEKMRLVIMLFPVKIDLNTNVHIKFRLELIKNAIHGLRHNHDSFMNRQDRLSSEFQSKESKLKATHIIVTPDRKIRVKLNKDTNDIALQTFIFKKPVCDLAGKFASQPLRAEKICALTAQPLDMEIIECWNVGSGVLMLVLQDNCLKLGFLPEGEECPCPRFVGDYLENNFTKGNVKVYADFAEDTRTLCYVFINKEASNPSKAEIMKSIQISDDFTSFNMLLSRSISFLQNISKDVNYVNGLKIDPSGNCCIIGLRNTEVFQNGTSEVLHQYAIFDLKSKMTLQKVYKFKAFSNGSLVPAGVYQRSDGQFVNILYSLFNNECYYICCCNQQIEPFNLRIPNDSKKFTLSVININNEHYSISYSKEPCLLKLNGKLSNIQSFTPTGSLSYAAWDINGCAKFAVDSIVNYGMSEIDRMPGNQMRFALEAMRIGLFYPYKNEEEASNIPKFIDTVTKLFAKIIDTPIDIPFYIQPFKITDKCKEVNLLQLFAGQDIKKTHDQAIIPVMARFTGMPRVWLHANPGTCIEKRSASLLNELAGRAIMKFPQMPFFRACNESPAMSGVFVDLFGSQSCNVLSALSGLPFTPLPRGSVSVGSTFVPIHYNEINKKEKTEHTKVKALEINRTFGKDDRLITRGNPNVSNYINITSDMFICHMLFSHVMQASVDTTETAAIALFTALASSEVCIISIGNRINSFVEAVKYLVAHFSGLSELTGMKVNAKRAVLHADLGTFPLITGQRLSRTIGCITSSVSKLHDVLFFSIMYIPSNQTVIKIARDIYHCAFMDYIEYQIVNNEKKPTNKTCSKVMESLQKSMGMFAALTETMKKV